MIVEELINYTNKNRNSIFKRRKVDLKSLKANNDRLDIFPNPFDILSLDILYYFFGCLDLRDLRSLAMVNRSFYRNLYNPRTCLFRLLVNKSPPFCIMKISKLKQGHAKRRCLLEFINRIPDFDNMVTTTTWQKIKGEVIYLDLHVQTFTPYVLSMQLMHDNLVEPSCRRITCYVTSHNRFKSIMTIGTKPILFKSIRHWLSHCLGLDLYQLDMKQLSKDIVVYSADGTGFVLNEIIYVR